MISMSGTIGSTCPAPRQCGVPLGRRFIAVHAPKQYFVLYETKSPETVRSEYMNNVRFGTAWSARTQLLNTHRAIFRVLFTLGAGQGGSLLCLRYSVAEGSEEDQRRLLAHDILPKLVDDAGIVGCHLLRIDARSMHASMNQGIHNKFSGPEHIGPTGWSSSKGARRRIAGASGARPAHRRSAGCRRGKRLDRVRSL